MADWIALGDRAIRFARPDRGARALVHAVRGWPGVVDVVVTGRDVAAYFAGPFAPIDPATWSARIAALAGAPEDPTPGRDVILHAVYDGPDRATVAEAAGCSLDDLRELHSQATYAVEMMGFSPGFAYLTGLPARLALPRRTTPRTQVPAGSLAIAGGYTAVYPFASPGGWHLIGRVLGPPMFGPAGARIQLGDRVRFEPA